MILLTGGCGFIGAALAKALLTNGEQVRVLDNCSRGNAGRLAGLDVEIVLDDIRNADAVKTAACGADEVIHLAYINGTKNFYSSPEVVLEVGVKGITNVIDACALHGIKKLTLASSSEVCRAKLVDADETIPLVIPDEFNPRYSYSAGKIISEMMAIHCGLFDRLLIVRPFNVYGPGMSEGHVIPDMIAQLKSLNGKNPAPFAILGNGAETRSFCYIDDLVAGVMLVREYGQHNGIYNIGTTDEISIGSLAHKLAGLAGRQITLQEANQLREGDAPRRRPDISKIESLGYRPRVDLETGLRTMLQ